MDSQTGGTVVDPRTSLATWLREGRAQRKLSLDDVARVTKIQPRILDKLERGELDGLPAEVFVRGFVRSFAKCVGLDEVEAVERLGKCRDGAAAPAAHALVETMAELAPRTAGAHAPTTAAVAASAPVAPAPVAPALVAAGPGIDPVTPAAHSERAAAEPASEARAPDVAQVAASSKRAARKKSPTAGTAPRGRRRKALGRAAGQDLASAMSASPGSAPSLDPARSPDPAPSSAVKGDAVVAEPSLAEGSGRIPAAAATSSELAAAAAVETTDTWQPVMPPAATTPTLPWRRPPVGPRAPIVPSLVIDDADPDRAAREQEDRAATKEPQRLSFLPPILLDREDRSARQGGLTLAVIILLIAATLTLSYLMRRPSPSGDGVTMHELDTTSQLG
jgi:cytoskeleton protein RodZ